MSQVIKLNKSTTMPAPPDIPWYHSYDLGDYKINGTQDLAYQKWRCEAIFDPLRNKPTVYAWPLRGKTILDICTWSGLMAFEAERLGGTVTAIDDVAWRLLRGREGFDYIHKHYNSRVTAEQVAIENLPSWLSGKHFDVILCLGVLYHVRNPISLVEAIVSHSTACVIDTLLGMTDCKQPAMQYLPKYEPTEMANYFLLNAPCVKHLMLDYGCKNVKITYDVCDNNRAIFHGTK